MGVAIFAARKIALLNSISNLEMMRMQISSQQQVISDKVMNLSMQQMNLQMNASSSSSSGTNWNSIGQLAAGLGGAAGSIFGGQTNGAEYAQYGAMAGSMVGTIGSLFSSSGGGASGTDAAQKQYLQMQQQIMQLTQQEKRLEMTAKTMETQLGMKNKELEGVEKGEEKAIARSGPKFE